MADFQTHIQTSCGLGAAYAVGGAIFGYPTDACLLAGGLCGLSGMLPDLDSDTGVPFRETTAFLAAISPMLMIDRWVSMGLSVESMVLFGAGVYLFIRFGVFTLLKWYTVHRGMFHSLPAMVIVGQAAFLLCTCHSLETRYFKAAGMMLGYLSHLLLDEFYSVDFYNLRIKKSFGTAIKLFGPQMGPNLIAYGGLGILALLVQQDPLFKMQWNLHARGLSTAVAAADHSLAPHASYSRNLYSPTYFQDEPASGPLAPLGSNTGMATSPYQGPINTYDPSVNMNNVQHNGANNDPGTYFNGAPRFNNDSSENNFSDSGAYNSGAYNNGPANYNSPPSGENVAPALGPPQGAQFTPYPYQLNQPAPGYPAEASQSTLSPVNR